MRTRSPVGLQFAFDCLPRKNTAVWVGVSRKNFDTPQRGVKGAGITVNGCDHLHEAQHTDVSQSRDYK